MPESEKQAPDITSKSQRKRDAAAVQTLAETLVGLASTALAKIPLSENVVSAIQFAHTLKAHGAKRRQMQYIAKLLREEELEPVIHALKLLKSGIIKK